MDVLISCRNDNAKQICLAIEVIRAHDFMLMPVPQSCIDELYKRLRHVRSVVLQEIVDEYGENEIGLAIKRSKEVQLTGHTLLDELKAKYGKHIVVRGQLDEVFHDPEHVTLRDIGQFQVPASWQNLRTIFPDHWKKGGGMAYAKITLPCTFPLLESAIIGDLVTEHVQPSLKSLTTFNALGIKASTIPNIVRLVCHRIEFDAPLLSLLVTAQCHREFTPNVKFVTSYASSSIPDSAVVSHFKFVNPTDRDQIGRGNQLVPISIDKDRYLHCKIVLEPSDRPLEFYGCNFVSTDGDKISQQEAQRLLPNATIL